MRDRARVTINYWQEVPYALYIDIKINDLEQPRIPRRGFSDFFAILVCSADFKSELRRNG